MNSTTTIAAADAQQVRKRCFAPVVDARTRVLVLGSLPGEQSLALQQYYGHPQNKCWELLGALLGTDLRGRDYAARLACLLEHGVGLWDVVAEAERAGSLDAAICHVAPNPLVALVDTLPALRAIAFNGGTAARLGRKQFPARPATLALIDLPSSSPAHTLAYAAKLERWRPLAVYL